jgi:hypothetical protein
MALIDCAECGHKISSSALACPSCGAPSNPAKPTGATVAPTGETSYIPVRKGGKRQACQLNARDPARVSKKVPTWAVLFTLFVFCPFLIWVMSESTSPSKKAECKTNLKCTGDENIFLASAYCQDEIARLARYSVRWTDTTKFSRFRWLNKKQGSVTFVGDKVEFQNGFGAFMPHTYECDFDPASKKVLDVRAAPGRLPS